MKVSIMPLRIAFPFLLVLSISKYLVESYDLVSAASDGGDAITAQGPMRNVITIASINYGVPMKQDLIHSGESRGEEKEDVVDVTTQYWNDAQAMAATTNSYCTDKNTCKTVICVGGLIYDLQVEFDYILNWCGSFKLSTLTIRNCQLDTIADNAFNYKTLNKLTNLTFVDVQLKSLNAQTFLGLEAVENFQLFNALKQVTLPLNASNFLQPMATSLSNLVLQQTEKSCCSNAIYDPTEWLGRNSATVYNKLTYVDLSGTKFNDTLNDVYKRQANTVCATPTDLAGTQIRFAQLRCHDTTTLTTIMTNLTTIGVTTTIAMETKTTMVTTTDYTTREPTGPISQENSISSTNTIANSTSSTTISADSTFPTSSSITSISPTTTVDRTEETTESNAEAPSTFSMTTNKNAMSTSSSGTSITPTTLDSSIINATWSHSQTSSTISTTTNDNSTLPTLSTSSSTTIMMPTTSDDKAEETTVPTSSGAASIHRW
ncbi:PREDICTED: cell wall protein DAN4-like [Bactrocera latifrons]|uniref:cell wall protein DAN4-like n=1 Tax=Bactrocera latifrons TaxID=174628 RepID=UPI0008DD5CFF|nr:PREDICTED: cell wall protein DAN4-like [Bactrocera latifrons]